MTLKMTGQLYKGFTFDVGNYEFQGKPYMLVVLSLAQLHTKDPSYPEYSQVLMSQWNPEENPETTVQMGMEEVLRLKSIIDTCIHKWDGKSLVSNKDKCSFCFVEREHVQDLSRE